MVDLLTERGVQGATVLEIAGGVGEIQLALLAARGRSPVVVHRGLVRHVAAATR
jgi:ubiquinone/menaquinone biosynthesis C-methylase UbiE